MTKLVYIGGYGHSGSTLLEYLMTLSPEVVGCGEVVGAAGKKRKEKCTCGRLAKDCPVWGSGFTDSLFKAGGWSHHSLTLTLLKQFSSSYAVMIDSSKTARGAAVAPFRLRRKLGRKFQLVHNVRDPRGVCWSVLKQATRKAKRENRHLPNKAVLCASSAVAWWASNLSCELFGWLYPEQYVRVRYEDLSRTPTEVLNHLSEKFSLPQQCYYRQSRTHDNRHQLHGNRMRHQQMSFLEIKEDGAWRAEMPFDYRRIVSILTSILRHRYGYR